MNSKDTGESVILFVGDIFVFFVALYLTLIARYFELPSMALFDEHFAPFALLFLAWVAVFFIAGLYDKHTAFLKRRIFGIIVHAQIINVVIAALFFFTIPYFGITPKTNLVIYLIISSGLLLLWRLVLFNALPSQRKRKALLIGEGKEAEELFLEVNQNSRYNFEFVRILDSEAILNTEDFEAKVLNVMSEEGISVIVADSRSEYMGPFLPFLFDLTFLHVDYVFLDLYKMYEGIFDRVPITLLRYDWFLEHVSQSSHVVYDFIKRIIDIVGGAVCGIFLLLMFPFIWLAIKLDDNGPIFIRQQRLGVYNKTIHVYKFRTMSQNEDGVWIGESVNQVTKVGAFLRKTSIDELPQVLNILKGDMSLIGPRNDMAGLASRLAEEIPYYNIRTIIKPGITGWAQTHQYYTPGNISPQSIEETATRLAYDLYYVKNRSLLLDISIALRTIKTLLSRFGINIVLR